MSSMEQMYAALLHPVVTEKTTRVSRQGRVLTFKVQPDADKALIKKAVETIFEVKVVAVNTTFNHQRGRRFGRFMGSASKVKKAYVTLAADSRLDLEEVSQ